MHQTHLVSINEGAEKQTTVFIAQSCNRVDYSILIEIKLGHYEINFGIICTYLQQRESVRSIEL